MRATDIHTRTDFELAVSGNGLRSTPHHGGFELGGNGSVRPTMSVEFEPGATAAGEARAALASLDGRIDGGVLDDIRLLVSELVTNSVRHSEAARDLVRLAVLSRGDTVRVEVSDGGHGFRPTARTKAQDEAGGWGLHLVDRLASRWGVERGRPVRVWFEIDAA